MGAHLYDVLMPTSRNRPIQPETFQRIWEVFGRYSKSPLPEIEVETSHAGGTFNSQTFSTLADLRQHLFSIRWTELTQLSVKLFEPEELDHLFLCADGPHENAKTDEEEDLFWLNYITVSLNTEEPNDVITGEHFEWAGYLPRCDGCGHSQVLSLSKVMLVHGQRNRWKCPGCRQVERVIWVDLEDSQEEFTEPFGINFCGPKTVDPPQKPCIKNPQFVRDLESAVGFSLREWFKRV